MKAKHRIEHAVFNSWVRKNLRTSDAKIIVGVSGGRDSMALLQALTVCFSKNKIVVVHCHHGDNDNRPHRDDAQELVREYCQKNSLTLELFKANKKLTSEAAYREFRLDSFQRAAEAYETSIVALAHHRDDWLETQLIKLIRGSSFLALRRNFQWSRLKSRGLVLWRPFSNQQRREIDVYRHDYKIPFVEDPTNADSKFFRNWLRNDWLPSLEKTRPGAVKRLALSLVQSISEVTPIEASFPWDFKANSIDFIYFLSLSDSDKLRCLAYFVRSKGIVSIKASQLKEILRQLDKANERYHIVFKTFECLVNAGQLLIKVRD